MDTFYKSLRGAGFRSLRSGSAWLLLVLVCTSAGRRSPRLQPGSGTRAGPERCAGPATPTPCTGFPTRAAGLQPCNNPQDPSAAGCGPERKPTPTLEAQRAGVEAGGSREQGRARESPAGSPLGWLLRNWDELPTHGLKRKRPSCSARLWGHGIS